MKSIVDMFKKKRIYTVDEIEEIQTKTNNCQSYIPDPYYPRPDLRPQDLAEGEFETIDEQHYRFKELPPITVLHELAEAVDGELTRLIPDNPSSTPIVLKNTKYGFVSIVWFKRLMQFTLYVTATYERNTDYKKSITQRRTLYGVEKAIRDINEDKYPGIFSED